MIGHINNARKKIDANTVAQYEFEGNLLSRTGKNNASLVGSIVYSGIQTNWQGGSTVAQLTVPGNALSLPVAPYLGASGTCEFIFSYSNPDATPDVFYQVSSSAATRHSELYVFGGNIYYYSNWPTAPYNNSVVAVVPNRSYYIGLAWDVSGLNLHISTQPAFPSSTPTATFNSPRFDTVTVSSIRLPATVVQGGGAPINRYDRLVLSSVKRNRFPSI